MIELPEPSSFYYSTQRAAGDILTYSVTFLVFAAGLATLDPRIGETMAIAWRDRPSGEESVLWLGILAIFFIVGSVAGAITGALFRFFNRLLAAVTPEGFPIADRAFFYRRIEGPVREKYREVLGESGCALTLGQELSTAEAIDRLILVLSHQHVEGYSDLERSYSRVAGLGQGFVYTLILAGLAIFHGHTQLTWLLVPLAPITYTAVFFATASNISRELSFIAALTGPGTGPSNEGAD